MVVLVQPRLSIIFISSKEGWCGESHTLPYPGHGYATAYSNPWPFFINTDLCNKLVTAPLAPVTKIDIPDECFANNY